MVREKRSPVDGRCSRFFFLSYLRERQSPLDKRRSSPRTAVAHILKSQAPVYLLSTVNIGGLLRIFLLPGPRTAAANIPRCPMSRSRTFASDSPIIIIIIIPIAHIPWLQIHLLTYHLEMVLYVLWDKVWFCMCCGDRSLLTLLGLF